MSKSIKEQFVDWLRTKPADERYEYGSNDNCAVCQFLRDTGICSVPRAGGDYWRDGRLPLTKENMHRLPFEPMELVSGEWTFGALLDRLTK